MKLSIIIPTYNGAKYIDMLLNNLSNFGLQSIEYEIIFVDDCSMDNTRAILKQKADSIANVRYVFNETNKKLATTCNVGLNNATGEYVWFVDQDDEVVEDIGRKIINLCIDGNLDVVLFNYSRIDEDGKYVDAPHVFETSDILDGRSYLHRYFEHEIVTYLLGYRWRALFRRQYLLDNHITFPDGLMHDDTTFLFQAIYYATRIKSIDESCYKYRVNLGSYTHSLKASRVYEQYVSVAREEIRLANLIVVQETGFADQIRKDAINKIAKYINKLSLIDQKEQRLGLKLLQNCEKDVVELMDVKTKLCMTPCFGIFFYGLYSSIYRLYKKNKT